MTADKETALDDGAPVIHPELGDNLAFRKEIGGGDVDAAFAVVEEVFRFGRHTGGVSLEPRAIIAEYDPSSERRLSSRRSPSYDPIHIGRRG